MGQAKKRGSYEQRVAQYQAAEEERQVSARLQRERDQATEDAAWELLTEEEKEVIRERRRERAKARSNILGTLNATSILLAAGQTARPRR